MAGSINGFGTTFYGSALPQSDGSYVVTKWMIMLFLPIVPLGSMRVWPVSQAETPWWKRSVGQQYKFIKVPLYMPHLMKGYAITLGLILFLKIVG